MMVLNHPLDKKKMKRTEDCFLKVKNDYLSFLSKEKIFDRSKAVKLKSLKKTYIPMSFWIENKYKKKRKNFIFRFFWWARFWKNNSYRDIKNYSNRNSLKERILC